MGVLIEWNLVRWPVACPTNNFNNHFDGAMADATAMHKFRFIPGQLKVLVVKLHLPAHIVTPSLDSVEALEALALLCRRLAEPSRLFTVGTEFGRSIEACSRIINEVVRLIYDRFANTIYIHETLLQRRAELFANAIRLKSSLQGLRTCLGFIDGTKHYVSRPGARPREDAQPFENLQRSLYNGHPRRHWFNYQAVVVPDGLIISMYGPVEGRRHDATVLAMSKILDVLKGNPTLRQFCLYGDPAYNCGDCITCPFPTPDPGSQEALFNSSMSSVREAFEWSFHILKSLWAFLNFDKKMMVRMSPIGKLWLVATLLTNCHTCFKPKGNQISMFFDVLPPSLDGYLCNE
ncbi:hypothetical protein LEN26_012721 [Aphanomyces euteiches]|nr:hypothetical protein AeMF1_020157 [Aphanomyces euteiches]KAH9117374.1 hypothetical protein LEN26_012721 [Aphanomyces euteiches]